MRFRFGITTLMGLILFVAVGLTALRSASALWVSATFTATVTLLSASILGAMAARGRPRMGWAGLAVFGWVYLGIAFGPWPRNVDGPPPLLTVPLLDAIQDYVFSDGKTPYLTDDYQSQYGRVTAFRGNWQPAKGNFGPAPPAGGFKMVDLVAYRQAGHSLGAVLFGVVGALVGRFFAARNGDDQPQSR
jgi:hypothetical protein